MSTWANHMIKQPPEVFYKKGVHKNFAKFTGKYVSRSLFINRVQSRGFSFEFSEIFKNTFLTEHFRATASAQLNNCGHKILTSSSSETKLS